MLSLTACHRVKGRLCAACTVGGELGGEVVRVGGKLGVEVFKVVVVSVLSGVAAKVLEASLGGSNRARQVQARSSEVGKANEA